MQIYSYLWCMELKDYTDGELLRELARRAKLRRNGNDYRCKDCKYFKTVTNYGKPVASLSENSIERAMIDAANKGCCPNKILTSGRFKMMSESTRSCVQFELKKII